MIFGRDIAYLNHYIPQPPPKWFPFQSARIFWYLNDFRPRYGLHKRICPKFPTYHNHHPNGYLCKTFMPKRIEVESRGGSSCIELRIYFPKIMYFFIFGWFPVEIRLRQVNMSESTTYHSHHPNGYLCQTLTPKQIEPESHGGTRVCMHVRTNMQILVQRGKWLYLGDTERLEVDL